MLEKMIGTSVVWGFMGFNDFVRATKHTLGVIYNYNFLNLVQNWFMKSVIGGDRN